MALGGVVFTCLSIYEKGLDGIEVSKYFGWKGN